MKILIKKIRNYKDIMAKYFKIIFNINKINKEKHYDILENLKKQNEIIQKKVII